eukprot:m.144581 g.144581  ORF g.144581 m.144581 type:complete len:121 (-) comp9674_c0_seq5:1594-1956(-)
MAGYRLAFGATLAAVAVAGAYYYFSQKNKKATRESPSSQQRSSPSTPVLDQAALNKLFVKEMTTAQAAMQQGDAAAAQHFANAVRLFPKRDELLQLIKAKTSPELFQQVLQHLAASSPAR